jgi:hypothetical protein
VWANRKHRIARSNEQHLFLIDPPKDLPPSGRSRIENPLLKSGNGGVVSAIGETPSLSDRVRETVPILQTRAASICDIKVSL